MPLYNQDKCRQRTRLAARQGFEAFPLRLAGATPPAAPEKGRLISARGTMPTGAAALERINSLQLAANPLTAEQVHVKYLEAGNTNFVSSRSMFLHASTLKNIAGAADAGFAFMNSHRTGGLSSPSELPMGRTFAGRYESWAMAGGQAFSRVVLGIYMLAGEYPNGQSGPSTDSLAAGIDAGTIFDVSLGIYGGQAICDVCGFDFQATDNEGRYLCLHVPGTTRRMSRDQIQAQKAKGVPEGIATYSIHNGTAGEISAVFDGAVPGAGFRRALTAMKGGLLDSRELAQVQLAYGHLLNTNHRGGVSRRFFDSGHAAAFHHEGKPMPRKISLSGLLGLLGVSSAEPGDEFELDDDVNALAARPTPSPSAQFSAGRIEPAPADPEVTKLQAQLAETNKRLKDAEEARTAERREAKLAAIDADVDQFCAAEKAADRVTAAQLTSLRPALRQAAIDDLDSPVDGFSRLSALKSLQASARPHGLTTENVASGSKPANLQTLSHNGDGQPKTALERAREQNDRFLGRKGSGSKA
jgi:hypothetical protein